MWGVIFSSPAARGEWMTGGVGVKGIIRRNMKASNEELTCRALRPILAQSVDGGDIPESEACLEMLTALEFFIPEVLAELYPEWKDESLDGFYPLVIRKTGRNGMEMFGLCILISDQTVTPIDLKLRIDSDRDEVAWLECRLGEAAEHGIGRWPLKSKTKRLFALEGRKDQIQWVYRVTYGEKR